MRYVANTKNVRRPFHRLWLPLLFVVLLLLSSSAIIYLNQWNNRPNSEHVQPDFNGLNEPIFYQGKLLAQSALGSDDTLKLPIDIVKAILDPTIIYEANSQSVIITTHNKVIRLQTDKLTGIINDKPFTLHFPVENDSGIIYLPIAPLEQYYPIEIRESAHTKAVQILKQGDVLQWGKTIVSGKHPQQTYALRSQPTIKAPIYADVKQGQSVIIWQEDNGWYRVQLDNGIMGYIAKVQVALDHVETIPGKPVQSNYIPWKPLGGYINLTWQQVYKKTPNMTKANPMQGLNVISPQWFSLADGLGNIKNLADASYVKWAHAQNLQVWALFSNSFDPSMTTSALSTYDRRMNMIRQLVSFAQLYQLQGINIDFENVALSDKDNVSQFVRELTPFLHEQGLVVSIDVTMKDGSDTYSRFMDRAAVGKVVDYVVIMAYDEYWASSPVAGSVSSLPWVEKGVTQIIAEDQVPAAKIILGVPFYTRIWTEQTVDGKTTVSSKAASMADVQKIISAQKLTPLFDAATGQDYVEYTIGNNKMKIWLENAISMQSRIDLLKKLHLAGVASWSRGFETPDMWALIQNDLTHKPF